MGSHLACLPNVIEQVASLLANERWGYGTWEGGRTPHGRLNRSFWRRTARRYIEKQNQSRRACAMHALSEENTHDE